MSLISWIKRNVLRQKPIAIFDRMESKNPLREFVYLDEVSLRSLLSSKKGEITDSTSKETTESFEGELNGTVGVNLSSMGRAESTSRFQTRNSSTLQTAKKATVQSWFRELDKIPDLRLIETVQQVRQFEDKSHVSTCEHGSVSMDSRRLIRGKIVEFKVRLSTDPIFHLVTLISEFKGMAQDYPDIMSASGGLDQIKEFEGISKILQRLLAGLIPVRAEVVDYVVIQISDIDYVVHVDAVSALDIKTRPLEIVCVTELSAYWKDIRRVLFSDAEFTMLCRMTSKGLQNKWTPIKLADLLSGLVPNLSDQLDDAMRLVSIADKKEEPVATVKPHANQTLITYKDAYLTEIDESPNQSQEALIIQFLNNLAMDDQSPTSQKQAFLDIDGFLSDMFGHQIDGERSLELRKIARKQTEFQHFPTSSIRPVSSPPDQVEPREEKHLLDVEVIAIYW